MDELFKLFENFEWNTFLDFIFKGLTSGTLLTLVINFIKNAKLKKTQSSDIVDLVSTNATPYFNKILNEITCKITNLVNSKMEDLQKNITVLSDMLVLSQSLDPQNKLALLELSKKINGVNKTIVEESIKEVEIQIKEKVEEKEKIDVAIEEMEQIVPL